MEDAEATPDRGALKPGIAYQLASMMFALLLTTAVIVLAGYYESLGLLLMQILFIAGPTAVPLLILPKRGWIALVSWLVIASLMTVGWSYVVYIDTRPYQGGGATFAVLLGWFTCLVAFLVASLVAALHWRFGGGGKSR